jgi:hypothetical protein
MLVKAFRAEMKIGHFTVNNFRIAYSGSTLMAFLAKHTFLVLQVYHSARWQSIGGAAIKDLCRSATSSHVPMSIHLDTRRLREGIQMTAVRPDDLSAQDLHRA